ncbi:CrcB family protein [Micrococcus endophyticus]|uniref:CrcB family protein n=1 Tax=Micrococcus endophyticus TaxID=455343 RepID=UPI002002E3AB|nr:CrcB family protein [Micrococcus endophyticus]MCK6090547.1 CrcB family protein [Micrococcus endophyticus]
MSPALMGASPWEWVLGLAVLAAGGALGALLRLTLQEHLPRRGVLAANTLAAGVLGFSLALALPSLVYASGLAGDPLGAAGLLVASLTAGFCLALGTWSTVAGQTADAVLAGRWGAAGRIWAAHLGLGLFAAAAGWGLGLGARLLLA